MPFRLRLGKRSQQYNVANKDLFVIPIEILTNEPIECTLLATSVGRECLNNVCQRLNIQQSEYFGLLFKSKRGVHQWVDLSKPLKKQLDKYSLESRLFLRLQFFVPNLHFLSDEVSRYHYFCSMKLLVIEGRLQCDRDEAVHLASFSLQAEFGDYNPERHTAEYLSNFALFPRQMVSNNKVAQDLHMEYVIDAYSKLQGVPPNVAEIYYISEAQQLDGIGQEGFPAKDNDTGADVCLGVTLKGIFVVHINSNKQEIFRWTDIANLIHQKKVFTIERNPDGLRKNYSTFDSDYASCVWKACVEQHQYFMKGLRNSVDTDSQQSDQSKQEVSNLNNNTNGTNNLHQNQQNLTPISSGADITAHTINKNSATALPQTLQTVEHFSENVNQNISTDGLQHTREYSAPNHRELTSDPIIRHLYTTSDNSIPYRNRSSTTDLRQIHINFVDNNDIPIQTTIDGHASTSSISNISNITTVQIHHQQSWAAIEPPPQLESELTFEQRRQLLPPYKPPPDYETFMRQKYGNLSVSVGNIGACIASSHPIANNYGRNGFILSSNSTSASSVRHFYPQQPYGQFKNYRDSSNLEIDKTGLNKCGVRSSLPPTQNWLPTDSLINSPSRLHHLTSGIITCSTPELNSLNVTKNEIKLEEKSSLPNTHHLLYLINNQRLPPPYGFNSVPDLSCQPMAVSKHIQNSVEPMTAVNENASRGQATTGSEPNIANIPLMTAYSTKINPIPQQMNSSNIMQSSVDKLLQSHALHINTSQGNHLSQSSNVQNIYNLSQLSQRQQPSAVNNHTQEAVSPRVVTQISTMNSQNITNNGENRNSNGITSTIGSYLVKKNDTKLELNVDPNKDRRVCALEESLNDSDFIREFDLLPRMNPTAKFTTALLNENIYRNRFRDILPYEDNRVKLTPTKENKSGYINASHVVMHLGNIRQHYIASQGPLPNTAQDFWQMVFEQSVNLIVMVTDFYESNQQKCFEYLPLTSEPPHNVTRFGDYEVVCQSTSMSITFITSTLVLTFNGQKRVLTHLRFTEWSDHSCPDDVHGFLAFLSEMDAIHRKSTREGSGFGRKRIQTISPILVHCSAGVGRSGVVILCDSLLKFLDYNSTEMLDVPKALTQLRFQRMLSVQHCQQFRFVCKVLAQYLANSRLI